MTTTPTEAAAHEAATREAAASLAGVETTVRSAAAVEPASGITGGCGTRKYCQFESVTRGQMAAFLKRAFQ